MSFCVVFYFLYAYNLIWSISESGVEKYRNFKIYISFTKKYFFCRTGRSKISKTMITTELIICMRYYTHSKPWRKIKRVQNDCQTFYAIKFQGRKSMNLSLNPGCETSSTLLPNLKRAVNRQPGYRPGDS